MKPTMMAEMCVTDDGSANSGVVWTKLCQDGTSNFIFLESLAFLVARVICLGEI